jgi:hypothetical protein
MNSNSSTTWLVRFRNSLCSLELLYGLSPIFLYPFAMTLRDDVLAARYFTIDLFEDHPAFSIATPGGFVLVLAFALVYSAGSVLFFHKEENVVTILSRTFLSSLFYFGLLYVVTHFLPENRDDLCVYDRPDSGPYCGALFGHALLMAVSLNASALCSRGLARSVRWVAGR